MTYADLLARLQMLSEEQLGQDVTVYDTENDETYALQMCDVTGEEPEGIANPCGVLDDGHFYLVRA